MATHLRLAPIPIEAGSTIPANRPIRVALTNVHALMRRGLRRLLDEDQEIAVIAEAQNLAATMLHVQSGRPHVLVLDLSLPGGSGIEAIRRLRECSPDTQIVALTTNESAAYAQQALAAGAVGFVLKDLADTELAQAVRLASRKEEYVSPRVAARLHRSGTRPQTVT